MLFFIWLPPKEWEQQPKFKYISCYSLSWKGQAETAEETGL